MAANTEKAARRSLITIAEIEYAREAKSWVAHAADLMNRFLPARVTTDSK